MQLITACWKKEHWTPTVQKLWWWIDCQRRGFHIPLTFKLQLYMLLKLYKLQCKRYIVVKILVGFPWTYDLRLSLYHPDVNSNEKLAHLKQWVGRRNIILKLNCSNTVWRKVCRNEEKNWCPLCDHVKTSWKEIV